MDFRYSRWDERLVQNLDLLKNLLSLYNRLLLITDGDVDEALRALEDLGERFGFFNETFGLEDFKKHLKDHRFLHLRRLRPGGSCVIEIDHFFALWL